MDATTLLTTRSMTVSEFRCDAGPDDTPFAECRTGHSIAYVRSGEPDLTNRQMALLMLVYLTPGPHTVRGLARVLGVSKPVVTRALNTLGALGYLRRERDQDDRRNVFVVRTNSGAEFLEGFKRNLREGDTGSAVHRPIIGQAPAYAHQR